MTSDTDTDDYTQPACIARLIVALNEAHPGVYEITDVIFNRRHRYDVRRKVDGRLMSQVWPDTMTFRPGDRLSVGRQSEKDHHALQQLRAIAIVRENGFKRWGEREPFIEPPRES